MRPRERDVETYFVEQVEKAGGFTRKLRWLCRRGAPDRFVFGLPSKSTLTGFAPVALVELKRPGCPADSHQQREGDKLRQRGVLVFVVDSFAAVDDFIRSMTA